jgi:hypothetical protein
MSHSPRISRSPSQRSSHRFVIPQEPRNSTQAESKLVEAVEQSALSAHQRINAITATIGTSEEEKGQIFFNLAVNVNDVLEAYLQKHLQAKQDLEARIRGFMKEASTIQRQLMEKPMSAQEEVGFHSVKNTLTHTRTHTHTHTHTQIHTRCFFVWPVHRLRLSLFHILYFVLNFNRRFLR